MAGVTGVTRAFRDINTNDEYILHGVLYGECETGAATSEKAVAITGIQTLKTGLSIRVKFTNAQTYDGNPTLNVNDLGAKSIMVNGSIAAGKDMWPAGEVLDLVYTGNAWHIVHGDGGPEKINLSEKGAVNGVAELDSNGKVLSSQLPSYVDDVLEFDSLAQFPETGESGKVYMAADTNLTYRWTGSTYVAIGNDLALGETSSTAYRGDRGAEAYAAAVTNVESVPISGSTNLITSGGVYREFQNVAAKADTVLDTTLSRGRKNNTTVGFGSYAFGGDVEASGWFSHAEGARTVAADQCSHAEGSETVASGSYSHAEGFGSSASNASGHAEGNRTTASGNYAHSEGSNTISSGSASHSEGASTAASGDQSHAEGSGTEASGSNSHAEGMGTKASGVQSHAEGTGSVASGNNAHAEGANTVAAGAGSHVSGAYNVADSYDGWPEWTANTVYAVGDKVKRTGSTTALGYICSTANNDSEFDSSKWNAQNGKMNYVEIIGNGTADNARSNARTLDWDGNERLMGDLYVECNADGSGGRKVIPMPTPPSSDGAYVLQCTVNNGTITYSWVSST